MRSISYWMRYAGWLTRQSVSGVSLSSTTIDLDDPRCTEPEEVGQKAATLARLKRDGWPVPEGCVVPAHVRVSDAAGEILRRWGATTLVARSSSPDEDHTECSRAGDYLSVLGVLGEERLIDAVERVRDSAANPIPVLVMPQLRPSFAGIAFSRSPTTGDPVVVIEAVDGIADDLTAGRIEGFRIEVGGRCGVPDSDAGLSGPEALRVATLAHRLEAALGTPQDIEWAIVDGALWVLQARPITALPQAPDDSVPERQTWLREDEHFGRPLRPLEFDIVTSPTDRASRVVFAEMGLPIAGLSHRLIDGWPYTRMVPLMDRGRDADADTPALLFGAAVRFVPPLRRRLRIAAGLLRSNWAVQSAKEWEDTWRSALDTESRRLRDVDISVIDDEALARHVIKIADYLNEATLAHVRLTGAMNLTVGRLGVFCRDHLEFVPAQVFDLIQGSAAASTDEGYQLARLGTLDRESEAFGHALRAYLDQFGWALPGFNFQQAPWSEEPAPLFGLLDRMKCVELKSAAARQQAADAALARARHRLSPELREDLDERVAAARRTAGLGDDSELAMRLGFALARRGALEAGKRLVERNLLGSPDETFWLSRRELLAVLRGHGRLPDIRRRRAEYRWALAHRGPERYGPPPPPPPSLRFVPRWAREFLEVMNWVMPAPELAVPSVAPSFQGIGISPGVARGPARVIGSPEEFGSLRPGDVLVCSSTWAAWAAVFPLLVGIVAERGGVLSHPSVTAREFGIPAVVGVRDAKKTFENGQMVELDGSSGIVRLLNDRS